MSVPPSRVVEQAMLPALPQGTIVLRAYGEGDDAARLTVQLAKQLQQVDPDAASRCLAPRASWRERQEALSTLLRKRAASSSDVYAAIVDFDALAPRPREREWDERPMLDRRQRFYERLCSAIDDGGWVITRPELSRQVSNDLGKLGVELAEPESSPASPSPLDALSPESRPIAHWLLKAGHLVERDLWHVLQQVENVDAHLIGIAYDALDPQTREVARLLTVRRSPAQKNGRLDPFKLGSMLGPRELPRDAVDELTKVGFLQADDSQHPASLRVPRRIRSMLSAYAAFEKDKRRAVHAAIASEGFEHRPIDVQAEIHHHAVRAGDVERAKSTARYYGDELRELATQLSRESKEFDDAATLFRHIVEHFDATDAYAWEYLGYNLARWDRSTGNRGRHQAEILDAYRKALQHARSNPLYHGRELGYKAELGFDIRGEFDRYIAEYYRLFDESGVSRFVEPVLDGLHRGKFDEEIKRILTQWRALLERTAPRSIAKHGAS